MNPPSEPSLPRQPRRHWLLIGAAVFLWLPVEDNSILFPLSLASIICFVTATEMLRRGASGGAGQLTRAAWVGLLAGLAVAPGAFALMALKTGVHSHTAPDFNAAQIAAVFRRAPWFALGGLLLAAGAALWKIAKKQ